MTRPEDELPRFIENERERCKARRETLGAGVHKDAPVFALALSGGGIRSATFALGVMQALNDVPIPAGAVGAPGAPTIAGGGAAPVLPSGSAPGSNPSRLSNLLARFDYLSTVSGGGYVGSFFCSLFVPWRLSGPDSLTQTEASIEAARLACEVMANEPPGRMRIEAEKKEGQLVRQPLAWLRENGRYLAPTGAGDMLYAGALAIRNWLAIQYVLATVIVAALSALMLIRAVLAVVLREHWLGLNPALMSSIASGLIWGVGIAIVLLWSFPTGVAFWLAHANRNQADTEIPKSYSLAALGDLVLGVVLGLLLWAGYFDRFLTFGLFFFAIGAQALLGFAAYVLSWAGCSVSAHRVVLTHSLAVSLKWAAFVFLFALADQLAANAYASLQESDWTFGGPVGPSALLAAAIWAVRHLAVLFDQKGEASWWRKLPLAWVAGVAALAIGLALIVIWAMVIYWMLGNGGEADPGALDRTSIWVLLSIAAVTAFMAWVVGQFPAFINLSSLQSIYSARLTRAYLGGSNGQRLAARRHSEGLKSEQGGSVAEPLPTDQITRQVYYGSEVLAPLHIINVTVNQTTDSNEQLVQRDRKGLPLAVLPCGFTIDGSFYCFAPDAGASAIAREPTVGEWVGTSGAAVGTGLGRTTTRGLSLLLGLANVRLGTWWQSQTWSREQKREDRNERGVIGWAVERLFATQYYLLLELTAQFHGLRRRWQYLSDGGHFDNTGIYELLRPERRVRFIVACDNGVDIDGRFDDLANLIRLARIDFGLELAINHEICDEPYLGRVFGRPADLMRGTSSKKCAMLIDVFCTDRATRVRERRCRIVVLKPRVIGGAPMDVVQYAAAHPEFPNESTSQQFFDEAQWESYRRLGVSIGRTVFGLGGSPASGSSDALWRFLDV